MDWSILHQRPGFIQIPRALALHLQVVPLPTCDLERQKGSVSIALSCSSCTAPPAGRPAAVDGNLPPCAAAHSATTTPASRNWFDWWDWEIINQVRGLLLLRSTAGTTHSASTPLFFSADLSSVRPIRRVVGHESRHDAEPRRSFSASDARCSHVRNLFFFFLVTCFPHLHCN